MADVISLLDHYDLESAHVVGHDWGAIVAWHLAGRHPDRVRTRVLSAEAVRNSWDGTLLARVHLVAPSPVNLAALPPVPSVTPPTSPFGDDRTRERDEGAWRDWPNWFASSSPERPST